MNVWKTGDAERECIMYAAVGRTNIFSTVTGAGLPCLVPSLAGTPIYERTFTPVLEGTLQLIFSELRANRTAVGDVTALTLGTLVEDMDGLRQELGLERVAVLGHSGHSILAFAYEVELFHARGKHAAFQRPAQPSLTVGLFRFRRGEQARVPVAGPSFWPGPIHGPGRHAPSRFGRHSPVHRGAPGAVGSKPRPRASRAAAASTSSPCLLRQILPADARLEPEDDPGKDRVVGHARPPALRLGSLWR